MHRITSTVALELKNPMNAVAVIFRVTVIITIIQTVPTGDN